jgi:cysteinyl-tRNA synthetase
VTLALRLHNTLTGSKELFEPLEPGRVRIYTCGPTVHDRIHVGNFRTFLFEDVLRRYLRYAGYQVTQVMNITDVEDKIIRKARAAGQSIAEYTAAFTGRFFEDLATLGAEEAEHYPRATAYIPQMVRLIQRLGELGHTYEREGSIYFRIATFPGYGKLSKIDLSGSRDGVRVDADEYDKENPKDFVLWKAAKPGEDFWESELGPGRPGWHIECSAMAMALLGETFDIHTGGVDNIFPHHENEIAQSESATRKPFARYWLHAQHLLMGDRKMAKSLGNFVTLGDLLERGHDPMAVRYLLIAGQYRTPQQFTEAALAQAATALERLRTLQGRLRELTEAEREDEGVQQLPASEAVAIVEASERGFREAMDDDLNTPRALGAVFDFVREANALLDRGAPPGGPALLLEALDRWDRVLGVLGGGAEVTKMELGATAAGRATLGTATFPAGTPVEVKELVQEREDARSRRDFPRSDELRRALLERGFVVEDTSSGPRVKRARQGQP